MMRRRVPAAKGSGPAVDAKSGTTSNVPAPISHSDPSTKDTTSSSNGLSEKLAARGEMDGSTVPLLSSSTASTTRGKSYHEIISLDGYVDDDISASAQGLKMSSRRSQWLVFAVTSGACAACNGVFAKLTTTELTTSIAHSVSIFLQLGEGNWIVEYLIRAMFFGLNLAFNGIMWYLFTKALTLHTSTTQVSIINTSSNFMLTAFLGLLIFSESLPPLWWLGAAMLVVGNVIIGRRTEGGDKRAGEGGTGASGEEGLEGGLLNGVEFDGVVEPIDIPELGVLTEEKYPKPREDELVVKNGSGSVPR